MIGRFGKATVGSLVGPGAINLSVGLAKDFQLTERFKLKFESSFTNLPNRPNFDDRATIYLRLTRTPAWERSDRFKPLAKVTLEEIESASLRCDLSSEPSASLASSA